MMDARDTCANCGTTLAGPWCHACGQRDLGTVVELRELVAEVASETFEVEGRLPRTLTSIAWRPGEYLEGYLQGRRRTFASPLRFFLLMLVVSALFIGWRGESGLRAALQENLGDDIRIVARTDRGLFFQLSRPLPSLPREVPWLASLDLPEAAICPPAPKDLDDRLDQLDSILAQQHTPVTASVLVLQAALSRLPWMMGLLVGFYALVLKLFAWRRATTVHVLTSMVFHTLAMVAVCGVLVWPTVWMVLLAGGWLQAHVVFGLRRAYPGPVWRTGLTYVLGGLLWLVGAQVAFFLALFLGLVDLANTMVP